MGVTVAISADAAAQATAANAAAQEAAQRSCMVYVRGYNPDKATVPEMREYASCIDRLYPAELDPVHIMAWKIVVAVLLIGMAVGAVREWKHSYSGSFEDVLLGSIMGFCGSCIVVVLAAGVWFLLSGSL